MPIQFSSLEINNLPLLHQWFLQPHVAQWWQEPTEAEQFYAKWSDRITAGVSAYHTRWFGHIVQIDAVPVGYIQHFFLTPQKLHGYPLSLTQTIGLDFFIGEPAYLGKKLSVPILTHYFQAIKQSNNHISTVLIDPAFTNNRAIHVYAKAGFKAFGQQTTSHGTVLLMYKHL